MGHRDEKFLEGKRQACKKSHGELTSLLTIQAMLGRGHMRT